MPEFCTCGAHLPPDARFCHKCGKPQYDEPLFEPDATPVITPATPPPLPPPEISFGNGTAVRIGFLAALVAVLLLVAFPLPFALLRLMATCIAAGFLAVFLYKRRTGRPVTLRGGARMGWITGIFSFTIFTVQLTAGVVATSGQGGIAAVLKSQFPPNDARYDQVIQLIQEPTTLAMFLLLCLFSLFILLTVLSTLGGLLGAKVLTREH